MPSWPFRLQPPHVPRPRFRTLPLSAGRVPASPQVEISPLPEQAHHARQAESSSFPTDWSVPFDCSPPRLTATQLSLGTGRRAFARRGLPPLSHGAIAGALGPALSRGSKQDGGRNHKPVSAPSGLRFLPPSCLRDCRLKAGMPDRSHPRRSATREIYTDLRAEAGNRGYGGQPRLVRTLVS